MLIRIQSHGFLIILVMMWINYQLNSWSHKSVVDLLCIMGCYSLDGGVNTRLTVQRHTCLIWYAVPFFNRRSKYKSKCRLWHSQICKERQVATQTNRILSILKEKPQYLKHYENSPFLVLWIQAFSRHLPSIQRNKQRVEIKCLPTSNNVERTLFLKIKQVIYLISS